MDENDPGLILREPDTVWILDRTLESIRSLTQFGDISSGKTDIYIAKEGSFPSGYGFVLRSRAPYKTQFDKWQAPSIDMF